MKALINGDDLERHCRVCNTVKPLTDFYKDKSGRSGRGYYCKVCANTKARDTYHRINKGNPRHRYQQRNAHYKREFGITLQEYEDKLAKQNFACAICGVKLPTSGPLTHLDHDHKHGMLRDFLCTNCNRGLGHFQDSVEILKKAADYLNTHNNRVVVVKEDNINESTH